MYAKREGSGETEADLSFHWSPICKVPKLCSSQIIVREVEVGKKQVEVCKLFVCKNVMFFLPILCFVCSKDKRNILLRQFF